MAISANAEFVNIDETIKTERAKTPVKNLDSLRGKKLLITKNPPITT